MSAVWCGGRTPPQGRPPQKLLSSGLRLMADFGRGHDTVGNPHRAQIA